MNTKELLAAELKICQIHSDRLNLALRKIEPLYPFSQETIANIRDEDLAYLDLLTTRLGKLQDTL